MAWTDDKKAEAVEMYLAAEPTPETSVEIVKEIAESLEETANGVRMILSKAEVYVKQVAAKAPTAAAAKAGDKAPRVSKADSIGALAALIESKGQEVDSEILDKLTGKQAIYIYNVIVGVIANG